MPPLLFEKFGCSLSASVITKGNAPMLFNDRVPDEVAMVMAQTSQFGPAASASSSVMPVPVPHQALGRQPRANGRQTDQPKPRIVNNSENQDPVYGSSGSDHEPSTMRLYAMVNEFLENDYVVRNESESVNSYSSNGNDTALASQFLQNLCHPVSEVERLLVGEINVCLESRSQQVCAHDGKRSSPSHGCIRRAVMDCLQKNGYNAAICKTRWSHNTSGIPAGDYEFIDVLINNNGFLEPVRLLIDIDFQAQFEIARPTNEYSSLMKLLPEVFVGQEQRLEQILYQMSEAAKRSLRTKKLLLPPWRKLNYMRAKWFSPYKRTINITPSHPCREGEQKVQAATRFAGIAMRGCGLDARCTSELEVFYHNASALNMICRNPASLRNQNQRAEITAVVTDWQPPAVMPRHTGVRKITGLSSLLSKVEART